MPSPANASIDPPALSGSTPSEKGLSLHAVRTVHSGPYDLHIAPGQCISLQGESGSGKSLLLRAIADLDRHQGQVWLDGHPASHYPAPLWRQHVGLLPAESQWWLDTVGAHFATHQCPYLSALGLPSDALTWPISRLSSGQKQRLALGRLLMNQPRVLLLDEPTSSLDSKTTQAVEAVVETYRHQHAAAVLWVSHDTDQARRVASRHYLLAENSLQEITA